MTKRTYSLIYKKNIIRALLKETIDRLNRAGVSCNETPIMWNIGMAEKSAYRIILDILNDDLMYIPKDIINEAEEMTMKQVNQMGKG